jgi:hypothetical protein
MPLPIQFKWSVKRLFTTSDEALGDVVHKVQFKVVATTTVLLPAHFEAPPGSPDVETVLDAESHGFVNLPKPDGEFTPYGDLSEDRVIGWVKDSLGEANVASITSSMTQIIERKVSPPQPKPPATLPWKN